MKKLLIFCSFFIYIQQASAQAENYTPFRWDMGMHYAQPDNYGMGVGFYTEPKYLLTDNLSVGLKAELSLLGRIRVNGTPDAGGSLGWVSSFLATTDYHFGDGLMRPTIGFGAGLYRPTAVSYSKGDLYPAFERGNKFGFSPRIGVDIWHFRLSADYNFIFNQYNLINGQGINLNQNHLTIKLGIFFGGGRLEEE